LSRTILDGHCLFSLLVAYDEHHVLEDKEEIIVGVMKKGYLFIFILKQRNQNMRLPFQGLTNF
jgi:hypothetical protein